RPRKRLLARRPRKRLLARKNKSSIFEPV
ncbi:uncharacterized protein METZ01_LOCUS190742, partial [marine metagenome]